MGKIVPYWMYFGQGKDFKLTMELSEKVQYSRNQATKNSLNEAILLMSINEDRTLCLLGNQDLILYEGDSNFNAQPVKIPHLKSPLMCKQAR